MPRRDDNDDRSWWDGNKTRVWHLFVTFFLAVITFVSAWIFNNVDQPPTPSPEPLGIIGGESALVDTDLSRRAALNRSARIVKP